MVWWFVLSSLFISSLVNNIYVVSDLAGDDRDALTAFKNAITKDDENCTQKWNENLINACTWDRITCNITDKRVTEIDLGECDIFGSLVEELGNLGELTTLFLQGNNFLGVPIPSAIGKLTKLKHLDLSSSLIEGQIPGELGLLPNLKFLKLSGNALEGNIPRELGNLISLVILHLDDNFLEGSIPYELSNLKNLGVLDLSSNNLNGTIIEDLPHIFPAVTKVNLTNNIGPGGQGGLVGNCTQTPCCYDMSTRESKACIV